MSLYHLIFGKMCHFLIELEHPVYWAVKNLILKVTDEKRILQLSKMDELCLGVYENVKLYKGNTKIWHDMHIRRRKFEEG